MTENISHAKLTKHNCFPVYVSIYNVNFYDISSENTSHLYDNVKLLRLKQFLTAAIS